MAPKRPNPLENPPAASSSEDEEEDPSEGETDQDEKKVGLASDEEDDNDSPLKKKPETAAPVVVRNSKHKPEDSVSEGESDSHSESESESEPERTKSNALKTLASKSMLETHGPKNPGSAVVGLPANSKAKRPSTELGKEGKESKRAKKTEEVKMTEEDESKKTGEDTKKQLFQRLFSEDDEIALLQGILEFTATKGDPYDHMDAFCEFVKKSINFDASKAQLFDKIRRLKRRFENLVKKSVWKGKNGEDCIFSKSHDQKAFDLWKKIWGSDGALRSAPKSAKSKKNQGGNSKALVHAGNDLFASPKRGEVKREGNKEVVNNFMLAGCKNEVITGRDMASLLKVENGTGFNELAVMQGWDMIDGSKKRELEEKWKKIRAAQVELLLQRNEFIGEAARLIFETLKANVPGFGH